MSNSIKLKLKQRDFECSICEQLILTTPIINSHNNPNGIYCLECVGNNQELYSFYKNTYLEGFISEKCSDDGLLPWTIKCFFCKETISHLSMINHLKNDCEDLNWIQDNNHPDFALGGLASQARISRFLAQHIAKGGVFPRFPDLENESSICPQFARNLR